MAITPARQNLGAALLLAAGTVLARRAWRRAHALDFAGKTVVIFGGSRGLGLVLAREFAAEGANLVLVARDRHELRRAQADIEDRGAPVLAIACDVRDRLQVEDTIEGALAEYGTIDVLINDAGIIQVGPFEHMTVADFEDAMATHFWGPLYATLAALPHMRVRGARRIVNISSIGGKIAVPHLVPYCASKFAVTGLSEGLHAELAREGIYVTTVCPGLMRTGSTYNAEFKGQHRREFGWFHVSDSMPGISMHARRAARQIIEACRYGEPELILTLPARLAVVLNAIAPKAMASLMSVTNRVLPAPTGSEGDQARTGWQSTSALVPSWFTTLADRASDENNELSRQTLSSNAQL